MLQERVENTLQAIGNKELSRPIFYNSPIGLRFEVGNKSTNNYNGDTLASEYIENALERVMELYKNSECEFDVLLWKRYPHDIAYDHSQLQKFIELAQLDLPHEQISVIDDFDGIDDPIETISCFWDLQTQSPNTERVFKEIITADLGGLSELVSSVYFFDTKANVLFFLYDDRGLDIVAQSKKSLSNLYEKYNPWIIDYDRKQIDLTFKM